MRILVLLLGVTLAGCLTTDEPAQTSAPPAQPAAATPADKPAPAQRRPAAAATRGANAPAVPAEPSPDAVMEIRQTCWAEGNKLRVNVEARADWVNKCVAEKTKALGL